MVNLPNTTPIALMNYFGAKSSQANSQLQTTFDARQPSQSTLPAAISNIQPGKSCPKPSRHEKTPLCCHSGVSGLNRQLTCVSVGIRMFW
jgi:hypothetical protein